jgi:hypothetical protein
VAFLSE